MKYLYLVVGESGSGKTTICNYLTKHYGLKQLDSYTTRPPRNPKETGHIFVSSSEFDTLRDQMVAYTEFNGYEYCATAQQIEDSDLYVIDPHGIEELKEAYKGDKPFKIIFIDAPLEIRYIRMKERALKDGMEFTEAVEAALDRITNDVEAFYDIRHNADSQPHVTISNEKTIKSAAEAVYSYIQSYETEDETSE